MTDRPPIETTRSAAAEDPPAAAALSPTDPTPADDDAAAHGPAPRVLFTAAGDDRAADFVAQFGALHAGSAVHLHVALHPGLHHHHLADTVADLIAVRGVAYTRWMQEPTSGLGLALRVALADYGVRTQTWEQLGDLPVPGGHAGEQVIYLQNTQSRDVLISTRPAHDVPTMIDQSRLDLAELVDQALRHWAERHTGDEGVFGPEVERGLRCRGCGLILGSRSTDAELATLALKSCHWCGAKLDAVTFCAERSRPEQEGV